MRLLHPAARRASQWPVHIYLRFHSGNHALFRRASSSATGGHNSSFRLPKEVHKGDEASQGKESDNGGLAQLAHQVRGSMRLVAHPVAIVTAAPANQPTDMSSTVPLRGLVVSSFNTICLDTPDGPLVSFNLKMPSSTYNAIFDAGCFDVSFPWSNDVCKAFMSPDARDGIEPSRMQKLLRARSTFAYRCKWLQDKSIQLADHMIMVGQVEQYILGDAAKSGSVNADKLPISYRNGSFCSFGG